MTGQQIIDKFLLDVDDSSELSDDEVLDLLNDVYTDICDDRDWEWLKKTVTDTTSTSVPYVSLPSDFKKLVANKDNESIVFVGSDYSEYKVIPFSSRRDYRDQDGFCYIDIPNQRLVFTLQPTSVKTIEYDYIFVPVAITVSTSPIFRSAFHKAIAFGMCARFPAIEQSNKSTSYGNEYGKMMFDQIQDMAVEDANIKLSQ